MSQQTAQIPHGGEQVQGRVGAVAAGHRDSVAAGLQILEAGGNAVDAAVAAAFTSFVVEPNNAGVAGYGHASAYLAAEDRFLTVDHNPRAPRGASADMFELEPSDDPDGLDWPGVVGEKSSSGALATGVPGAILGLWDLHSRAGRLPWKDLIQPAIAAAETGVEVTWNLILEIVARQDEVLASPAATALLMPGGKLPKPANAYGPGDRLDQKALAAILRRVADEGPSAFYEGAVADAIAQAVADGGGILDAQDLADYRSVVIEDDARQSFAGVELVTSNDTFGLEALKVIDRLPVAAAEAGSAEDLHLLAEAMGVAFADNLTYYGDPEHADSPVSGLASDAFAAARAAQISPDAALPRPIAPADPWPYDDAQRPAGDDPQRGAGGTQGTTFAVTADADGNVVALITTIGSDFGCLTVVPDSGIILNTGMANFDPRPGRANAIAPGKMPAFGVPAIVAAKDGRGVFAAAGAGGYPILTSVVTTTTNVLVHGLEVQAAIDVPRVYCQGGATEVDSRVPAATRARLVELGHQVEVKDTTPGSLIFSRVGALQVAADGTVTAGSGPEYFAAAGAR